MKFWIRAALACLIPLVTVSAQPLPPRPPVTPYGVYAAQLTPGGSFLGVHIVEVDEDRAKELDMPAANGVEIMSTAKGSPAEEAGIERGDVILEFRNERVVGVEHFMRLVRETPVGREVPVAIWRGGTRQTLNVQVGHRKPAQYSFRFGCKGDDCKKPGFDFTMPNFDIDIPIPHVVFRTRALGAELESIKGQLAEHFGVKEGVLVRSVDANSPARQATLQAGDIIISVDGETVRTPRHVRSAVRSADDQTVDIEVMRDHAKKTIQIESKGRGGPSPNPRSHPFRAPAQRTRRL